MKKTRIYLFRHGETDWNRLWKFQGHTDIPLNETGKKQAQKLIRPLNAAKLDVILSSDLSRALKTAEIAAHNTGVKLVTSTSLREANLGLAEGKTPDEIELQFGRELVLKWKSNRWTDLDAGYPDGETGFQVLDRVKKFLFEYLEKNPEHKSVGVSTHGGVIRRVMQSILEKDHPPVPIPNCILYSLEFCWDDKTLNLYPTLDF